MRFLFGRGKRGKETVPAAAVQPKPTASAAKDLPMSSDGLHAPRERLSKLTLHLHQAISSLREELEAVDWYRQRADDCDDAELKGLLLHNMKEEIEHASMILEWIRRNEPLFDKELKEYLFATGPILGKEKEAMGRK
jgi:hypothetical protein